MKIIILDRDGVINHDSDDYIKSPDEWRPLDGSLQAIAALTRADYKVVIITNQSGIGRGLYSINALNRIHQKMLASLQTHGGEINAIFFCPHTPEENCACRKPKPGMFKQVAKRLNRDLKGVYAIGDSLRDLQAALAGGATPVLVKTGKGLDTEKQIKKEKDAALKKIEVHADLAAFVGKLLTRKKS